MKVIKLFLLVVCYLISASCSDVPKEVLDNYFNSNGFIAISMAIIDDNSIEEKTVKDGLTNRMKARVSSIDGLYINSLEHQLDSNNDSFYDFLRINNILNFVDYKIQIERKNSKDIPHFFGVKSFHKYSDEFKKNVSIENNIQRFYLAERKLEKIISKNKFEQSILNHKIEGVSIQFEYTISPKIKSFPTPKKTFFGNISFFKHPENNSWKLQSVSLDDKKEIEILSLLPTSSIKTFISTQRKKIKDEIYNSRIIDVKESERIELKLSVIDNSEYDGKGHYLGLVSNDYYINIEPLSTGINRTDLLFQDYVGGFWDQHFRANLKLEPGEIISNVSQKGGTNFKFNKIEGPINFDLMYATIGSYIGINQINPYNCFIKLYGNIGSTAKITLYRVNKYRNPIELIPK